VVDDDDDDAFVAVGGGEFVVVMVMDAFVVEDWVTLLMRRMRMMWLMYTEISCVVGMLHSLKHLCQ